MSRFAFGTPTYWRERADEARSIAEEMGDAEAQQAMLEIAAGYEKVAQRAEAALHRPPSFTKVNYDTPNGPGGENLAR